MNKNASPTWRISAWHPVRTSRWKRPVAREHGSRGVWQTGRTDKCILGWRPFSEKIFYNQKKNFWKKRHSKWMPKLWNLFKKIFWEFKNTKFRIFLMSKTWFSELLIKILQAFKLHKNYQKMRIEQLLKIWNRI